MGSVAMAHFARLQKEREARQGTVVTVAYRVDAGHFGEIEAEMLNELVRDFYFDQTGIVVPVEDVFTNEWDFGQPSMYDDGTRWVEGTAKIRFTRQIAKEDHES